VSGRWRGMLPRDPLPALQASDEPAARWVTLVELLDRPPGDDQVRDAHAAVLADRGTRELLYRLPDWEDPPRIGGHDAPAFAPNLLQLLGDLGLAGDDDARIAGLLDRMLDHSDEDGRFAALGAPRGIGQPYWSALQCDTFAIADVLVRFGRGADARVRRALTRIAADLADTPQGRAWPCRPDPVTGFRGPGRKADCCPMLLVEGLRVFSRLPDDERPAWLPEAGRVLLRAWRARGMEKPYVFGHGRQFKTVKWPPTWYGAYLVLDAVGRLPELWRGAGALPEDRRAVAELAACLMAYNVGGDGMVTPKSVRRGFESFSFGQKKRPSAWATARLCVVLRRVEELSEDIAAVDVLALSSSKGGSGTAVPPRE
jgi:hypothetical protein